MPNARREGQTLISFQADETLVGLVETARKRTNRSLFIREALGDKLREMGLPVTEDMIYGPDRVSSDTAAAPRVQAFPKFVNASARLNEPGAGEPAGPLPARVPYKLSPKKRARKTAGKK